MLQSVGRTGLEPVTERL